MNQKQLANVLIKILGVSACLTAIPRFLVDVLWAVESAKAAKSTLAEMQFYPSAIGVFVEVAVAVFLILKSRSIAAFLFKHDEP